VTVAAVTVVAATGVAVTDAAVIGVVVTYVDVTGAVVRGAVVRGAAGADVVGAGDVAIPMIAALESLLLVQIQQDARVSRKCGRAVSHATLVTMALQSQLVQQTMGTSVSQKDACQVPQRKGGQKLWWYQSEVKIKQL